MVDIDRERKAILLPDDSLVPYDHLVLAPELADRSLSLIGTGERGAFSLADDDAIDSAVAYLASTCAVASGEPVCRPSLLHEPFTLIERRPWPTPPFIMCSFWLLCRSWSTATRSTPTPRSRGCARAALRRTGSSSSRPRRARPRPSRRLVTRGSRRRSRTC